MNANGKAKTNSLWSVVLIVATLAASAIAIAAAPAIMPVSYSWVVHSISESAGQNVQGAWLARTGFLLFGLAVLWLSSVSSPRWGRPATAMHRTYGVLFFAVAAFSSKPWMAGVPFDAFEDFLHSAAASLMVAFTLGVFFAARRRVQLGGLITPLDVAAFALTLLIPLAMQLVPAYLGVFQRLMFLIAYSWYALEGLRAARPVTAPAAIAKSGGRHERRRSASMSETTQLAS